MFLSSFPLHPHSTETAAAEVTNELPVAKSSGHLFGLTFFDLLAKVDYFLLEAFSHWLCDVHFPFFLLSPLVAPSPLLDL
jgi:hypothetical protein